MAQMSNKGSDFTPELRLFVKGPVFKDDKDCKFAEDIFSRRYMFIMAEKEIPNARVIPIDVTKKDDILRRFGVSDTSVKIPCLQHVLHEDDSIINDDQQEIEIYLESKFPRRMGLNNVKAYKAPLNVFLKFMAFFKAERGSSLEQAKLRVLNVELEQINASLSEVEGPFLNGNEITLPDCNLLPKLHSMRVAGKYYKQFEIPDKLTALKKYIEHGDLNDSFQQSKCCDKEIIKGYEKYIC